MHKPNICILYAILLLSHRICNYVQCTFSNLSYRQIEMDINMVELELTDIYHFIHRQQNPSNFYLLKLLNWYHATNSAFILPWMDVGIHLQLNEIEFCAFVNKYKHQNRQQNNGITFTSTKSQIVKSILS